MRDDRETRSRIMRAVKGENTGPEILVRRMVRGMGYRYRLHSAALPGKPDLVFSRLRRVIFVHGCFWHGHSCSRGARVPKSNRAYWTRKIDGNRIRDKRNVAALKSAGWNSLLVWECELRNEDRVRHKIEKFLTGPRR